MQGTRPGGEEKGHRRNITRYVKRDRTKKKTKNRVGLARKGIGSLKKLREERGGPPEHEQGKKQMSVTGRESRDAKLGKRPRTSQTERERKDGGGKIVPPTTRRMSF